MRKLSGNAAGWKARPRRFATALRPRLLPRLRDPLGMTIMLSSIEHAHDVAWLANLFVGQHAHAAILTRLGHAHLGQR